MYGGNTKTIAIPIYTVLPYCVIQYMNEHFCTSPNCSTDSSPQNVLTCNLALGQEATCSYTVIDLGLAELRSVRDSVALRSYTDSRSHSVSRARPRKARSYIG